VITFKKITFANFLSVGNAPVSVALDTTKTTLISGANGSGKSTVLDALCYALYNKPFRKINLPQLLNTQNKKGLLTEVEFTIGSVHYLVVRGQKPKKFQLFINGEEFSKLAADKDTQQHLEQNILKLSYKSFCQVCILGSAQYQPFMQLPTASRRDCVEDFLDIKVFSAMALIAKERLRGVKDQVRIIDGDISNLQFKIDVQKDRCNEIQRKAQESTQEYKDELKQISEAISKTRSLISRVETHQQNVLALRERLDESKPAEKVSEVQKVIAKLEQKIERLDKDNAFYSKNDDCPTCRQAITEETKKGNMESNNENIVNNTFRISEGRSVLQKMQVKLRILNNRDRHLESLRNSLTKYYTELDNLESRGKRVVDKLRDLEADTGDYNKESGKLEVLIDDLNNLGERKDYLVEDLRDLEVVTGLLKDSGIKTQVVRKYLPVMNKMIRQYLTELDLPIHFKLDEEFNETVASPLHRDFSYASFSEGQKARIDLALMFTWREIGKLKNSVSTNLLVLDEVFSSSLDETGKELLLALLRYKLPDYNNILVVDHTLSGEFKAKFERSIEVTRTKGFTHYS
jgi:DNA repair exonuclease SbcCD ATPase subunit